MTFHTFQLINKCPFYTSNSYFLCIFYAFSIGEGTSSGTSQSQTPGRSQSQTQDISSGEAFANRLTHMERVAELGDADERVNIANRALLERGIERVYRADRENDRLYRVNRSSHVNVRKFNTAGTDLHIRVKNHHFTNDFVEVLKTIYKVFQQIIDDYIEPLPDNSLVRMVLSSDDLDIPISMRFQHKKYFTPEAVFTQIKNVVQSRKAFNIDREFRINIVYTTIPEGRGPKKSGVRMAHKKSIITVCNGETDNLGDISTLADPSIVSNLKGDIYE